LLAGPLWTLYTAPSGQVDADLLRAFIADQVTMNLLSESRTLELKRLRHGDNVARTVAAFANTDGGILLLGVDEKHPDFDTSPGVDAREVVALVDQLRSVLDPPVDVEPIPVALPGNPTKVIVVLRVPQSADVPVLLDGRVLRRLPGQTVGATREQLLGLISRSSSVAPVMALSSAFYPQEEPSLSEMLNFDAHIRVAGGVWLRSAAAGELMLGSVERTRMITAFEASPFVRQLSWMARTAPSEWVSGARSTMHFTVSISYRDGTDRHDLQLKVVKEGLRVSFAVDLRARVRDAPQLISERPGKLARTELAAALLDGIELVSMQLPNAVSELAKEPPWRVERVSSWVRSDGVSVSDVLDMQDARVTAPQRVHRWGFECEAVRDTQEASDIVRRNLAGLYVDVGAEDEQKLAEADVAEALRMRAALLMS
jgi:hypothetical protein